MTKTHIFLLAGTALGAVILLGVPANADDQGPKRKPTVEELLQRIEALENKADENKDAEAAQRQRITTLEQNATEVSWAYANGRPTISTGDGRFSMSIRSRFHVDAASFMQGDDIDDGDHDVPFAQRDLASGVVVRRAQFGIEGKVFKDFWYELRFNFGGSDTESAASAVNLMRVAYMGIPNFRLNIGIIQPIFTYADAVSSNEITFMERPSVINTILDPFGGSDSRRGIEATFQKQNFLFGGDNFVLTGALTGQTIGSSRSVTSPAPCTTTSPCTVDEGTQALGRFAYRLWSDGVSNVQIGASGATILNMTHAGTGTTARNIQFRDRPEMRIDGTRLVDTGAIPADGAWLYGFEGGANFKNFYVGGEYYKFGVDRDLECTGCNTTAENPDFSGWYVEGSWVITGEPKPYAASSNSNNVGVWGGPKVIKPFSLAGNSWGTWELAARYSTLNLNFKEGSFGTPIDSAIGAIRGGEQTIWGVGLNWYLNNNVRTMFNYLNVDVDRLTSNAAGLQRGQKMDIIGGRVQFAM